MVGLMDGTTRFEDWRQGLAPVKVVRMRLEEQMPAEEWGLETPQSCKGVIEPANIGEVVPGRSI